MTGTLWTKEVMQRQYQLHQESAAITDNEVQAMPMIDHTHY